MSAHLRLFDRQQLDLEAAGARPHRDIGNEATGDLELMIAQRFGKAGLGPAVGERVAKAALLAREGDAVPGSALVNDKFGHQSERCEDSVERDEQAAVRVAAHDRAPARRI